MASNNNNDHNIHCPQAGASSDAPSSNRGASMAHEDDASHRTARLPHSMNIGRDTSQPDAHAGFAAIAPDGTLGGAVVGKSPQQGPLFS